MNRIQEWTTPRRTRAAGLAALYVAGLWLALFHIAFDDHHCHSHCTPDTPASASLLPGDHDPCGHLHHDLDDHRDLARAETKAPVRTLSPIVVAVADWHAPDPRPDLVEPPEAAARPLPVLVDTASPRAPPAELTV